MNGMDQSHEQIDGDRMMERLQEWIETGRLCRMVIPETDHAWITILLGMETQGSSSSLTVDLIKGGEKIISHYRERGLRFEFLEKDGVLYWFDTRLIQIGAQVLRVTLPPSIFRMQRRRFVRIGARLGTELLFQKTNGNIVSASVKDYGLGGVSFSTPPLFHMRIDDCVSEVELKIPNEKGWSRFRIPKAKVKRVEKNEGSGGICVLEFLEIPELERERFWQFIFKEQRFQLRKTGKI